MSMQQAFRDYFSTQYLYTFLFYWCLINHQMWLLNFTISSKLKRIVDLLWYYWEFNFNVDVGRREVAQTRFRLEMWENDSTWETRKLQSDCLASIQRIWLDCQRLECHLFLFPRCLRLSCLWWRADGNSDKEPAPWTAPVQISLWFMREIRF